MNSEDLELTFFLLAFIVFLVIIILYQYRVINRSDKEISSLHLKRKGIESNVPKLAAQQFDDFKEKELNSVKREIKEFENKRAELNLEKWKIEAEY